MLEFELVDEHSNTTSYVLEEGEYLLGKGDQCDVILADSHASRVHCKLHISQDQALLADNSSTNGTWYKGERLDSEHALKADDVV